MNPEKLLREDVYAAARGVGWWTAEVGKFFLSAAGLAVLGVVWAVASVGRLFRAPRKFSDKKPPKCRRNPRRRSRRR